MAQPIRQVVFIGEVGAGKSSVINLFADRECARTSPDATRCTLEFVPCDVSIDGTKYRLWDTPGLVPNGWIWKSPTVRPLENFLLERYRWGELGLIVFCVRGNRASAEAMLKAYKTLVRGIRQMEIPVALAITHLERAQPTMDTWWQENELSLMSLGLFFDGHACLTCLSPHHRRWSSQQEIRSLISTTYRRGLVSLCSSAEPIFNLSTPKWSLDILGGPSAPQREAKQKEDSPDQTIKSLRADLRAQNTQSMDLEKTVKELRTKLANSQQRHGQEIKNLETTIQQLRIQLSDSQQDANKFSTALANSNQFIRALRQNLECETLYAEGRVIDAAKSLLNITRTMSDDTKSDVAIMGWLSGFTNKCVATLEQVGDEASRTRNDDDALSAYAMALSLCPSNPTTLLNKWVNTMLLHGSTNEILDGAREFKLQKLGVYHAICDILEGNGQITEAIRCFRQMKSESTKATDVSGERAQWEFDFQQRCAKKLEKLADTALSSQNHNEAEKHYSIILSLDPLNRAEILFNRSKARAMMKLWKDALKDADEVIKMDPSSHLGYERRHAALLGLKRRVEAVAAHDTMLLKLKESPDIRVHELRSRHAEVITAIRRIIHATVSPMPRILIDTTTGHLNDKTQQVKAFEALPIFNDLVSSMTDNVDYARIWREVKEFYQYVMFSHRWEHGEPLFQKVMEITVYKLETSRGNLKLQKFCSLVRSLGYRWAWSDTCCIDKENNVVLQESLVAMFAWYRGSSLTVIHLLGVSSLSEEPDGVKRSVWNTRVWTYQEYVAAKRVLFYTEDWKPYLGLTLENHKDSPTILGEMEMSQVYSEQVDSLQPGLDRVREKLYLASTRETTLVEDIAYSLLGILNASIPVIYGEGTRAVGRLLEYVLTGSGDATILAWTGTASDYNSCLPANLTVYQMVVPPHIPHMETAELDLAEVELRAFLPDMSLATTLFDELNKLPPPTVTSSRLRLPGIVSHITHISVSELDSQIYHATADLFGDMEIKMTSDLATTKGLFLVHPWIRPLLDQEFARDSTGLDLTTEALRLIVRLQQPFGALLFERVSRTEYKRVAADSLIMVRFRDGVSLPDLTSNIRTIEVL